MVYFLLPATTSYGQVLRKEDLFNPAFISLEICPGCGLQEGENVPSRHCMMHCVSQHRIARDLSLQLGQKRTPKSYGLIGQNAALPNMLQKEVQ